MFKICTAADVATAILHSASGSRLPAVSREVARNVAGAVAALHRTLDELPRLPYPVTQFPIKVVAVIASVNKYNT